MRPGNGQSAQAKAHLTQLEADFKRAGELLRQQAISQAEYERASGDRAEAQTTLRWPRQQSTLPSSPWNIPAS